MVRGLRYCDLQAECHPVGDVPASKKNCGSMIRAQKKHLVPTGFVEPRRTSAVRKRLNVSPKIPRGDEVQDARLAAP